MLILIFLHFIYKEQLEPIWETFLACLIVLDSLCEVFGGPVTTDFISTIFFFFLIGIHPLQGWTATTRHGVTRKEAQKGLQDTENLFRKNLHLKDVC